MRGAFPDRRRKEKGERRKEKGERRKEKGERRKEKGGEGANTGGCSQTIPELLSECQAPSWRLEPSELAGCDPGLVPDLLGKVCHRASNELQDEGTFSSFKIRQMTVFVQFAEKN